MSQREGSDYDGWHTTIFDMHANLPGHLRSGTTVAHPRCLSKTTMHPSQPLLLICQIRQPEHVHMPGVNRTNYLALNLRHPAGPGKGKSPSAVSDSTPDGLLFRSIFYFVSQIYLSKGFDSYSPSVVCNYNMLQL